jgi:hypothetical protein
VLLVPEQLRRRRHKSRKMVVESSHKECGLTKGKENTTKTKKIIIVERF